MGLIVTLHAVIALQILYFQPSLFPNSTERTRDTIFPGNAIISKLKGTRNCWPMLLLSRQTYIFPNRIIYVQRSFPSLGESKMQLASDYSAYVRLTVEIL